MFTPDLPFKARRGLQLASCFHQNEPIEYCRPVLAGKGYDTGISLVNKEKIYGQYIQMAWRN